MDALKGGDIVTSRPMVEIGILGVFFIIWTAANGFSTPRWDAIQPGTCSAITIGSLGIKHSLLSMLIIPQ